jgi:hypothetical protein
MKKQNKRKRKKVKSRFTSTFRSRTSCIGLYRQARFGRLPTPIWLLRFAPEDPSADICVEDVECVCQALRLLVFF